MENHTPGPWAWKQSKTNDFYNLVAIGDYGFHPNGDKVEPVVHSDGSACGEYGADIDVHGADAKLIAAAPDLLEACEEALMMIDEYQRHPIVIKLKAAIKKARGEQ
jgi:hypothetical protein